MGFGRKSRNPVLGKPLGRLDLGGGPHGADLHDVPCASGFLHGDFRSESVLVTRDGRQAALVESVLWSVWNGLPGLKPGWSPRVIDLHPVVGVVYKWQDAFLCESWVCFYPPNGTPAVAFVDKYPPSEVSHLANVPSISGRGAWWEATEAHQLWQPAAHRLSWAVILDDHPHRPCFVR